MVFWRLRGSIKALGRVELLVVSKRFRGRVKFLVVF